ncbi:hypothetical protein SAMN05661099_0883 [Daejeonella lutea]|uniref:Uncharacterized protein n=2 Tax=Daejeonella lutea TaxID=572036 RepID=A0A1T5AMP2_9SPHI|nr:hypothetical protein SAMN05661099_0883 [Daejeonella lutea]
MELILISKWVTFGFGLFFILIGILMVLKPETARNVLRKAGSTFFINYAEITLRLIPASAMIIFADYSKYPELLMAFGWFMLATSLVLYFVPRKLHHKFSLKAAGILKPVYFQLISPFSMLIGCFLIYSVCGC